MTKMVFVILLLICAFLGYIQETQGHPQCLDFYPPFKATPPLNFCYQHSKVGCCSSKHDRDLEYDYNYHLQYVSEEVKETCATSFKELMCAECHPYASHLFDAESPPRNEPQFVKRSVVFPGLCKDFCIKYFDKCRPLWAQKARSEEFSEFIKNATTFEFCDWAAIPDKDYCYPAVENINKKTDLLLAKSNKLTTLCVEPLYGLYSNALVAVHANDGTHRLFIGEQRGLVFVRLADGRQLNEPFLDVTDRIINSGSPWDERGFLGLTFHPKYAENGRFFTYYSTRRKPKVNASAIEDLWEVPHKIRISEFTVSSINPNKGNESSEIILLEVDQPEANHDGGMIMFGDDNYLYIFVGDGGGGGDRHGAVGNAQNMSTLLGKVLRIDVDAGDVAYKIPRDNPFVNKQRIRPEIYAYGIRNIWRCSKDRGHTRSLRGKGRIFCGDVGQNKFEEIDIIERGGNYGWRALEGFHCYDKNLCNLPSMKKSIPPILTYSHKFGKSVVGGYVYRGCNYPNLHGYYVYGDTMNGRLFIAKEHTNGTWTETDVAMGNSSLCNNGLASAYARNILSFAEEENGELLMLSTFYPAPHSGAGRLYRLVDPARRRDPARCKIKPVQPRDTSHIRPRLVTKDRKKVECTDKSWLCKLFTGAKPRFSCIKYRQYVMSNCRKSCNMC